MNYHEKFALLKKELGYTNKEIASITGLSLSNIKNRTRPTAEFPSWLKLVVDVWERSDIKLIKPPETIGDKKPLTSKEIRAMVDKNKSG